MLSNKLALAVVALGLGMTAQALAGEYQRSRAWHAAPHASRMHTQRWPGGHHGGPVTGSYFQRPYPYHLDYYRMRYGGSYAPYFGNQYGVPQVYAPAYGFPPYGVGYGWSVPQAPYVQPGAAEE